MEVEWLGNVRELKQVVDVATAFSQTILDATAVRAALSQRSGSTRGKAAIDDRRERRELMTALQNVSWDVDPRRSWAFHRATIYRRMKRHGVEAPRGTNRRADFASAILQ